MKNENILKLLDAFFKAEDHILCKAMGKMSVLMISRGIDQREEREELLELRKELKELIKLDEIQEGIKELRKKHGK